LFAPGGRLCGGRGTFEMISIRFLVSRMCFARILANARDSGEPIGKIAGFINCYPRRE
jgi:hypothetical protein